MPRLPPSLRSWRTQAGVVKCLAMAPIKPNYVTVSTAEIQKYLKGAGRNTAIDALRLTTHSRGHRGLEQTMGGAAGGKAGCSLKASVLNPR